MEVVVEDVDVCQKLPELTSPQQHTYTLVRIFS